MGTPTFDKVSRWERIIPINTKLKERNSQQARVKAAVVSVSKWDQQVAFDKLMELITKTSALAYFDVNSKTRVVVDASPVGLRAVSILLQELSGGLLLMLQEV